MCPGMSHPGDRLWLADRFPVRGGPAHYRAQSLCGAERARHSAAGALPGQDHQSQPGARRGRRMTSTLMAQSVREAGAAAETPVLQGNPGDAELTDRLLSPLWTGSRRWWLLFGAAALGTIWLG